MNNINLENMWNDYYKEKERVRRRRVVKKCKIFLKTTLPEILKTIITETHYDVDDISKMLMVNKETVRRWLRTGKLRGVKKSKKQGYIVTDTMLNEFLKKHPKYAKRMLKET